MSKAKLKKELDKLDKEQLVQLVLDFYTVNKTAKDYFEFFLDPDITKLREKYSAVIDKEIVRKKWGNTKARFTVIRKAVRDFESYGVGPEHVVKLMIHALQAGLTAEYILHATSAFVNGMEKLVTDIIKYGDKNEIYSTALSQLDTTLTEAQGTKRFVKHLRAVAGLD